MVATRAKIWALAFAAAFGSASVAAAQQPDNPLNHPLKSVMKIIGFATDPARGAGFRGPSRGRRTSPGYIPIFQPPPEPARPSSRTRI